MVKPKYTMKKLLLLCTAALLITATGCKKELNESVQSAEDNAQLETEFLQIYDMVADLASTEGRTRKTEGYLLPNGATITYTDTTFLDADGVDFTIDFGPLEHGANYKGIQCKDGRYRAGKLRVGISKRYTEIPHILTIAINNNEEYYVGNGSKMHQVTGSEIITRTSNTDFDIEISDATLKRDNGTVNYAATYSLTRTEEGNDGWWDSKYTLTGSSTGNNANGENFESTIVNALQKEITIGCASTFHSGTSSLVTNSKTFDVNYDIDGAETCDRIIKVTIDGKDKDITLF